MIVKKKFIKLILINIYVYFCQMKLEIVSYLIHRKSDFFIEVFKNLAKYRFENILC